MRSYSIPSLSISYLSFHCFTSDLSSSTLSQHSVSSSFILSILVSCCFLSTSTLVLKSVLTNSSKLLDSSTFFCWALSLVLTYFSLMDISASFVSSAVIISLSTALPLPSSTSFIFLLSCLSVASSSNLDRRTSLFYDSYSERFFSVTSSLSIRICCLRRDSS